MSTNEAFNAIATEIHDLHDYLSALITHYSATGADDDDTPRSTWRLPDGALLTCDPPLTREEVADAEDCDPEDTQPVGD
ncbi:hypothetical protein [Thiobacter aerophilum]|uniref:Uncharacterized protein n=1 Tax=Thiobacter aerophilum TaxID=3121275 RepID=A0ABV0EGZ2_9BURK